MPEDKTPQNAIPEEQPLEGPFCGAKDKGFAWLSIPLLRISDATEKEYYIYKNLEEHISIEAETVIDALEAGHVDHPVKIIHALATIGNVIDEAKLDFVSHKEASDHSTPVFEKIGEAAPAPTPLAEAEKSETAEPQPAISDGNTQVQSPAVEPTPPQETDGSPPS